MHPTKYRTQLCKESGTCSRAVCFFAHSLSELRTLGADAATPSPAPAHPPPSRPGFAAAAEDSYTSVSSGLLSDERSSSSFTMPSQGSQGFASRDVSMGVGSDQGNSICTDGGSVGDCLVVIC
jgi:hypothetical protein